MKPPRSVHSGTLFAMMLAASSGLPNLPPAVYGVPPRTGSRLRDLDATDPALDEARKERARLKRERKAKRKGPSDAPEV